MRDGADVKVMVKKVAQLQPEALSLLLLELNQQTRDPESGFKLLDIEGLIMWITTHLERISDAFNVNSLKLNIHVNLIQMISLRFFLLRTPPW